MANAVNWFEIYVDDMDRAKAFYEAVFDKKLLLQHTSDDSGTMYMFPMESGAPNAGGALMKHPEGSPGMGGTMVYFQCDDVANEAARVLENGGNLLQDKMSIGEYGFIAMFKDTEGNCVGLHSNA